MCVNCPSKNEMALAPRGKSRQSDVSMKSGMVG